MPRSGVLVQVGAVVDAGDGVDAPPDVVDREADADGDMDDTPSMLAHLSTVTTPANKGSFDALRRSISLRFARGRHPVDVGIQRTVTAAASASKSTQGSSAIPWCWCAER